MRLVDLFDHLPEIMKEKPDYCSLLCDSQHTLIFDHLEIRPEMELVEVIYKKEHFMDAVIKDKAEVISKELYKLTKNTILEIQELKYLPKNMRRSL